jgi:HPt (histidine-containing phosphotransfer) domain-containing protein
VAAEAAQMPRLDPSSLKAYETSLGGGDFGRELVLDLIRMYREDAPTALSRMEAAVEATDAGALCAAAHALKGSSANLGAQRLSQLCFALELLGKAGCCEGSAGLLAGVQGEYQELLPLLESEVARRSE